MPNKLWKYFIVGAHYATSFELLIAPDMIGDDETTNTVGPLTSAWSRFGLLGPKDEVGSNPEGGGRRLGFQ